MECAMKFNASDVSRFSWTNFEVAHKKQGRVPVSVINSKMLNQALTQSVAANCQRSSSKRTTEILHSNGFGLNECVKICPTVFAAETTINLEARINHTTAAARIITQ